MSTIFCVFGFFLATREGEKSRNNKKKVKIRKNIFLKNICPHRDLNPELPIRSQVYMPQTYGVYIYIAVKNRSWIEVQPIHKNCLKKWKISKKLLTTYFKIQILINF